MSTKKPLITLLTIITTANVYSPISTATTYNPTAAERLSWIISTENRCGGYYLESPFTYPENLVGTDKILINSNEGLFSLHGTSVGQGKVTITREGQQVIANKAYIYRDSTTGKISGIELFDHVTLREPNSLVVAKHGHYNVKNKSQSLDDVYYRTTIYSVAHPKPKPPTNEQLQTTRKIYQLSAWGHATGYQKDEPKIEVFQNATYSTCPPVTTVWQVSAREIKLNKNTGRGTAKDAKLLVRGVPVLYTPYFNFPIDKQRQTGFLTPTVGSSSKAGAYLRTPFYWNMAPNYDLTLTPAYLAKRGLQIGNLFRYLTPTSEGAFNLTVLPNDRAFSNFQDAAIGKYQTSPDPAIQAELTRLENASPTRKGFSWKDKSRFNDNWSADIDYNYVSDDYYLRDLSNNLNEVTQNQLLQLGEINYKSQHWNFLTRIQSYQTLHPIQENIFKNQYSRFPQLVLEGDYPNRSYGLEYFVTNDLTRFDIRNTPGDSTKLPMGNRLHVQPGIALPINHSAYYFIPRLQLAMTRYEIGRVQNNFPSNPGRVLPIFNINSGLNFDRDISFLNHAYRQTLEPQIYYTYVPYRNQNELPVFDTTVNEFIYDELFTYNRFSGYDRIGDANQVSVGLTSRLIDQQSGFERVRMGIGQIFYFKKRYVTLCNENDPNCTIDTPSDPENRYNKSPLAGVLNYTINPNWSVTADSTWNPISNHLDKQNVQLHYQPNSNRIVNVGYTYLRKGDIMQNTLPDSSANNLSQTDLSFTWPVARDWSALTRWTQNWNRHHFQNLLYGVQYDSCCWAVRIITGRAFVGLSPSNSYQYNTEFFIQFALKGLDTIGNADPSQLLNSNISGYQSHFGQDF